MKRTDSLKPPNPKHNDNDLSCTSKSHSRLNWTQDWIGYSDYSVVARKSPLKNPEQYPSKVWICKIIFIHQGHIKLIKRHLQC